jgi:hypothetical protein
MRFEQGRRAALVLVVLALALTGSAAAQEERGIDPNQGESLVEVNVANKAAALRLQDAAEGYGVTFNDHYFRQNADGSATVTVFGTEDELSALEEAGYDVSITIESPETWAERIAEREATIQEEKAAKAAARNAPALQRRHSSARASAAEQALADELVVLRVDYFTNYAGRFLSVEAKTREGGVDEDGDYAGPTLWLYWNNGAGTPFHTFTRPMNINVDGDTTPNTYVEHRELVRIPEGAGTPTAIRIGSSTGAAIEAPVNVWLGGGLPPMNAGYLSDFTTRYMDPTEVRDRFFSLAAEFPNLATIVPLPHLTNGYQRKAQATVGALATTVSVATAAGATALRVGSTTGLAPGTRIWVDTGANRESRTVASIVTPNPPSPGTNVNLTAPLTLAHAANAPVLFGEQNPGNTAAGAAAPGAVVFTSTAWGHLGGNDTTVELRDPGAANSPLMVSAMGRNSLVTLGTDAAGELASTAAQVVAAVNADPAARALAVAVTYRGNAGSGVVLPRSQVALSDFLTTATNAHVQRGPFQNYLMRIRKGNQPNKVSVLLFCQQHAREWATPLTCLETAEQLLRNYALEPRDKTTRKLVDNLDILILPSSNPDGSHYSIHNFGQQRKNMTNHCVVGGKTTDDPMAANYWTPRVNPGTGAPYTNTDPASRTAWGVDPNRNNTFGTISDTFGGLTYIGASHSCTSELYTGPAELVNGMLVGAEASEPEIKNEIWVAETFKPKFSNNIHSFGGYFMWAPGTYLSDRGEGDAVHANIGVEKYFFEAGDQILNRIKDVRGTAILPQRTGPIADVLYSAAGNSADEHFYVHGSIAYSFETGADRYVEAPTTVSIATAAGVDRLRVGNRNSFKAADTITFEKGTANEETAVVAEIRNSPTGGNPPSPEPNIVLTAPLTKAHAAGAPIAGGVVQSGVGFQPAYATEGKFEALEFAAGNYGLLESALAYAKDDDKPKVIMTGDWSSKEPIETTFQYVNEPSVIHYTMDGSQPTESSTLWEATGPREPGETFTITETTTVRWRAEDMKGNVSFGQKKFTIR